MGGKWREALCYQFYWIWFELIVNYNKTNMADKDEVEDQNDDYEEKVREF